ncbi:hypothetical protein D3C80_938800 [compost metagenome]
MVENAFLQGRQGVDILHIGGTARHARDDAVERRLVEFDQAEQVWGDTRAVGRNTICRHHDLLITPQCRGQGRNRWLAEQGAHIDLQALQPQPCGQADRQQRMASEFEEVVVPAYLLHAEQFGPQSSQQGFGFTERGLVQALMQCTVRGRQRVAVEFAIRRQRQVVEVDVLRRQHVFR